MPAGQIQEPEGVGPAEVSQRRRPHDLRCDPIDDHPEDIAPLFCQEFRHEPHGFDDLRHLPALPGDHGQERSAKVRATSTLNSNSRAGFMAL